MSTSLLISEHAAASDRALFDGRSGRWMTYGELRSMVSDAAGRLGAHRTKSLLTLFTSGAVTDIVWYLAAMDAGHAVMLGDSATPETHKRQLLDAYAPEWVVDETGLQERGGDRQNASIHEDQALLLSTSGTTGSRKHVCLSRRNLECNADSIVAALGIEAADRAITTLPLQYSYGLSVVNSHLRAGASIVINPFSVIQPEFWALVHETQATSMAGVPFVYEILARLGNAQIADSPIRVMTQAGGRLAPDLIGRFRALMDSVGGRFFVMYGQTEATARISILHHDDVCRKPGSVGRVIPGGRICVQTRFADDDSGGEVVYRGPNVMLGYAETRDDLALGDRLCRVLHTGDLGCLDADGFLYVNGRSQRIAKVSGKRVSLDDIEHMVSAEWPHAVVGRDDEIYIFCAAGTSDGFVELTRRLSAATGLHRAVFRFRRIDAIPLTSSGKIDYQNLTGRL